MSEKISQESEPIKSEKEMTWEKNRKEIDEIGDRLGLGIDEGIKETVIAFRVNEFPTSGSCEGHADKALPVPWIEIKAPHEPEERFIRQNEAFEGIAKKYNLPFEEIIIGSNMDAYWEAYESLTEETEEWKKWEEENNKLQAKVEEILKEFYENRNVESDIELKTYRGVGSVRIHNGGKDYKDLIKHSEKVSEERKQKRAEKLAKYKAEMDEFAEFLKRKFLEE